MKPQFSSNYSRQCFWALGQKRRKRKLASHLKQGCHIRKQVFVWPIYDSVSLYIKLYTLWNARPIKVYLSCCITRTLNSELVGNWRFFSKVLQWRNTWVWSRYILQFEKNTLWENESIEQGIVLIIDIAQLFIMPPYSASCPPFYPGPKSLWKSISNPSYAPVAGCTTSVMWCGEGKEKKKERKKERQMHRLPSKWVVVFGSLSRCLWNRQENCFKKVLPKFIKLLSLLLSDPLFSNVVPLDSGIV
jgi:hypothetical protein